MNTALHRVRRAVSEAIKDARYSARNRRIRTFIVSFPKTGRTWLRMMVGKALVDAYGFSDRRIPDTYRISRRAVHGPVVFTHGGRRHLLDDRPFDQLCFDHDLYAGKRIVFLIRDIRDTLVSYYFQLARREGRFTGNISEFLRDPQHGARRIVRFYSLWFDNRDVPEQFMLLRYEDMRRETDPELRRVLRFIGLQGDWVRLAHDAALYGSFDNMKKMEQDRHFQRRMMTPGDPRDADSYKVRKGKVGGYVDYLGPEDQTYIAEVITELGMPGCDWYLAPPVTQPTAHPVPPGPNAVA